MQKANDKSATAVGSEELTEIRLFANLAEAERRELCGHLHRKAFAAGTPLMTAEQPGEVVYFILSGTVKVHIAQASGEEVIIAILGPGESIGEMSALDENTRSAGVTTIEDSCLLWVDRATFHRFLFALPALNYNLSCLLSARLRQADKQIQSLATRAAEARIAGQLMHFAEQYGRPQPNGDLLIPIRLTQSDIASLVGASREHTNKILVSYRERGYLSADHNYHLTIHDQRALARRCG